MRVFRYLAAFFAALILTGCSRAAEPNAADGLPVSEQVTLWIPEGHTDLVTELCREFIGQHPDRRYTLILNEMPEQEMTPAAMTGEDAPDVLFLPSELLPPLAAAGVLSKPDSTAINCGRLAADSATFAGRLLAYPCAAECCILYYDRSLLSDADAQSFNTILEKEMDIKANLAADLHSEDMLYSFFSGAGYAPDSSSGDCGLVLLELLADLAENDRFIAECDDHDIRNGFAKRRIAAAFSGPCNAEAIASSLGSSFGAAKLPTVELPDGSTLQPRSIASFLLVAVNENSAAPATAHELAQHLTNSASQLQRLQDTGLVPTDINLAYNADVRAQFPVVGAVYDQLQHSALVPSGTQRQSICTACETLCDRLLTADYDSLQTCLDEYRSLLRQ